MNSQEAARLSLAASREAWAPPPGLSKPARAIWVAINDAVTLDHFAQGDEQALAIYCELVARLNKVSAALDRLPVAPTDPERQRVRRALVNELTSLRAQVLGYSRALRLVPSSRKGRDQASTALPTRNRKRGGKVAPGDDLFAC